MGCALHAVRFLPCSSSGLKSLDPQGLASSAGANVGTHLIDGHRPTAPPGKTVFLVREAEHAQSKADFISKMSIALKEANETDYWIDLLHQAGYIAQDGYDSIHPDCQELLKLLVSIVKSSKVPSTPH